MKCSTYVYHILENDYNNMLTEAMWKFMLISAIKINSFPDLHFLNPSTLPVNVCL
jgi:hypothetical protein